MGKLASRAAKTMAPCSPLADRLIRARMPEIDTLRGVAILGVLFLHGFYWQYPSFHFAGVERWFFLATKAGWLGVNLFFVLSGFLITGILLDTKGQPGYYRHFYTRRALRILPAYYALLALLLVLRQLSTSYFCLSFIYLSNVTVLLGVANDYGPLWSLAVEEHYYIVWPTLVRRLSPAMVGFLALSICIVEPILRAGAFSLGYDRGLALYTWFVADGLATGSVLAAVLRTSIPRTGVKVICGLLLVGSFAASAAGRGRGILRRDNLLGAALQHTVIDAAFAGTLLLFLLLGSGPWRPSVSSRALRLCGYISYGLYLIHLLVFRLYDRVIGSLCPSLLPFDGRFGLIALRFVCAASVSAGIAYASRRFFEERFLRLRRTETQIGPLPPARFLTPAKPALQRNGGSL